MPSSSYLYICEVIRFITACSPNSILDIGPGFGKYGVLCREFFDIVFCRINREDWKVRIDCVEVFEKYLTPLHKYVYNNIYIGKAEDLILSLDTYDIILIVGIIEHMEKDIGIRFLKNCLQRSKAVVVVTPKGFRPQESVCNNDFETHRSGWDIKDFKSLGFNCALVDVPRKPKFEIVACWRRK